MVITAIRIASVKNEKIVKRILSIIYEVRQMLLFFRNAMSLFAAIYFILNYRKIKGYLIGFPLYFYFAFFPYFFVVYGVNVADSAVKLLLLAELLLLLRKRRVKCGILAFPVIFVAIICFGGIIASGTSIYFETSLFASGLINIIYIFVVIFLLYNRVNSFEAMNVIFKSMQYNGVILCVCAVIEKYVFNQPRVELSMLNPNYFAFYIAIVLVVSAYYTRKKILILLLLFGIYLSGSAAVLMGLLFCCVIVFLSKVIGKRSLTYIVMSISLAIPAIALFFIFLGGYSKSGIVMKLISWKDPMRIAIWTNGIRDFGVRPLWGYGYNCWRLSYADYIYVSHNDFLRIMVDCGFIGVIAVIVGWFCITRRVAESKNTVFYLLLVAIISTFACLHNNLNSYFCWFFLMLVFFDKYLTRNITIEEKA